MSSTHFRKLSDLRVGGGSKGGLRGRQGDYNHHSYHVFFCCSVAKSCLTLCNPMDCNTSGFPVIHYPGVCSDSYALSQWHRLTISSCATPFSFCLQCFPPSFSIGSFPVSQLFILGSQNIGASAPASVLPMNIQGLFPLGLTGLISLLSNGLSRVFSSTTIWKHQFSGAQPSLWSNSHMHTWLLERP